MLLLLVSFFAGILTVIAPCILPLLPIILTGSIEDKKGPYVIIASSAISIIIFSLLLKASTLFISIPQSFWNYLSGGIILFVGIAFLFPNLWQYFAIKSKFEEKSNNVLSTATTKKGLVKNILIGFSFGPIFSSCSPTYALIIAIILPKDPIIGFINLISYVVGLSLVLLLISVFGQKIVAKLKFLSNPKGYFKKILAVIFLVIGLFIITGFDKKIESFLIDNGYFDFTDIESNILDKINYDRNESDNSKLNEIELNENIGISENKINNLLTNTTIMNKNDLNEKNSIGNGSLAKAYFAGGCFWCMEGIFEAQPGVKEAVTGYAGGNEETANYNQVSTGKTGHREAVEVIYDPSIISYEKLIELYWTQIDPTNAKGQFADIGFQYTTAIFYQNSNEKMLAENSKNILENSKKFDKPIETKLIPFTNFFPAEEYHQDYYKKQSERYLSYKKGSGRESFIEKNWGNDFAHLNKNENKKVTWYKNYNNDLVNSFSGRILLFFHADWCSTCKSLEKEIIESKKIPNDLLILKVDYDSDTELKKKYQILSQSTFIQIDNNGNAYKRIFGKAKLDNVIDNLASKDDILKQKLTPLEYKVTQMGGTETPFDNSYWDNHESGIYVDIIDGTPLFSSTDKFDSGTGWPSFTQPIDKNLVGENNDDSHGMSRTEITSSSSNSHLGHVFNDGPTESGGLRYCINSAALRFIPVDNMEKEGYGKYLFLFNK